MLAALYADQVCVSDPWACASKPIGMSGIAAIKRARVAEPSDDDDTPVVAAPKRLKPQPRAAPLIHVARSHAAVLQLATPPSTMADKALLSTAVDDTVVLPGDVIDLARAVREQTGIELQLDATLPRLIPCVKEEAASAMAVTLSHVPARINCGVSARVPMHRARGKVVPIGWDS